MCIWYRLFGYIQHKHLYTWYWSHSALKKKQKNCIDRYNAILLYTPSTTPKIHQSKSFKNEMKTFWIYFYFLFLMQYIRGVILNEFFYVAFFSPSVLSHMCTDFFFVTLALEMLLCDFFFFLFGDHINCLFSYFGISICILNFMGQGMLYLIQKTILSINIIFQFGRSCVILFPVWTHMRLDYSC